MGEVIRSKRSKPDMGPAAACGRPPSPHPLFEALRVLLFRVPVDDRAEQLPVLAGESHHLHLFDRIEIGRRGLDADARDIGLISKSIFATTFMTFSRVRLLPHSFSTWTSAVDRL